jgi:hypothetical protein
VNLPLPVLSGMFNIRSLDAQLTLGGFQQIINPNPNRWALIMAAPPGVTLCSVSPFPGGGAAAGYALQSTTLPWVLTFSQVGALIHGPWYGEINPVGNFIVITEVEFLPPPGGV